MGVSRLKNDIKGNQKKNSFLKNRALVVNNCTPTVVFFTKNEYLFPTGIKPLPQFLVLAVIVS